MKLPALEALLQRPGALHRQIECVKVVGVKKSTTHPKY
jgi:hypothetical protein